MSLGQRIAARRKELKISQEYVAGQLGVSRQAVSKWETGLSEPTAKNLVELAGLFQMTVSELVEPEKLSQSISEKPKRNWKLGFERFAVIAYSGSAVLYTVETSDPGFKLYAIILILLSAIWMAINIARLPAAVRRKMALKELCYCITIYCVVTFLEPVIYNVYTSIVIMILCLVYMKYIRFPEKKQ